MANIKYIIKLVASTIVVIRGAAALAGSILSFFAIKGSIPPARFAEIKEIVIVRLTTKLIENVVLFDPKIYNLIKFKVAQQPTLFLKQ